jgi:hypothetical protein
MQASASSNMQVDSVDMIVVQIKSKGGNEQTPQNQGTRVNLSQCSYLEPDV